MYKPYLTNNGWRKDEDERYIPDPSELDDYDDYLEDQFRTQHEVECHSCSGTGEGNGSGGGCIWCGGKGYIIKKH